jgi:hypothetical protein
MADYLDHIHQAEHNENFGKLLLAQHAPYYDWLITVSFYAAIHYVEAAFNQDSNIKHTETCTPEGVSVHNHRQELVRQKYGKECWKSYRKLREASEDVRYLVVGQIGQATQYYKFKDAENFFKNHLAVVKRATGN